MTVLCRRTLGIGDGNIHKTYVKGSIGKASILFNFSPLWHVKIKKTAQVKSDIEGNIYSTCCSLLFKTIEYTENSVMSG